MDNIKFYNRYTGETETEQVYGEAFLKWAYGNPLGKLALHVMVKRPVFSKWYGWRMDQPASRKKVHPFIQDYGTDVDELAASPDSYATFNEFFYRKLKPEARPVADSPIVFPADGRHLGFPNIDQIDGFFVKGQKFNLDVLLDDAELAKQFRGGTLVLSRLCPVDYHRFHFPVAGKAGSTRLINGPLFSVSPIALARNLAYLWQNKRTITQIDTATMGSVLMLEIGATCVGAIDQTYHENSAVEKASEKGYFSFGGSSTITIFEAGKVQLADDLLENSAQQVETYARMGDRMAQLA
ncbi:MAG: phosphatidylserine decarboxylase [Akkermansiaceae bacterium]